MKFISEENLSLIPDLIKKIIKILKNQENQEHKIIEMDELPFSFKIPKSNKYSKHQIKIPKWLIPLIPILGINDEINGLSIKEIQEIVNNLVKNIPQYKNNSQSDQKDKKLINSILKEILEIQKNKE